MPRWFVIAACMPLWLVSAYKNLVSLKVPDLDHQFADMVLGFDSLDGYRQNTPVLRGKRALPVALVDT